jgi:hypothetical protein
VSTLSAPRVAAAPVTLPISRAMLWLLGVALAALAVYYFLGVDEGAASRPCSRAPRSWSRSAW